MFFTDRFAAAFRAELSAFVDVAAGTRPSPCTIDDALETGWTAEAEHRPVRVDEAKDRLG